MNKFTPAIIWCSVLLSFIQVRAQQVFKTTPASVIPYYEYLPQDYQANSDKYPIVIFLHGIGERCPNSNDPNVLRQYIGSVAKLGPPKRVATGTQFPFILISPQLKNVYGDWPTDYVMEVINHCKTYLRIDERRIYLTGLSLGGGGTWWTAQDRPELFAAIAPVCGSRNSTSKACGIASENLPVWSFHGDKDLVVPLSRSPAMVNAINKCIPAPSPLAKLTIYGGVAHNAWDYAYRTDNSMHTPNVYQWMLSHTNQRNSGNQIPIANAGSDRTLTVTSTSLTGSSTDADGTVVNYEWMKLDGPALTMTNTNGSTVSLTNLVAGRYTLKLVVTDNNGARDSDYVAITVTDGAKNALPVANAGPNQYITLPANAATIKGTATDGDGKITSYKWTKFSGGAATMAGTTTSTLSVAGLSEGNYVFRLTVTDDAGASDYDDMLLKVSAPTVPVVNAGADKIVKLPTTSVTLYGSASDAGGTVAGYQWTKLAGGSCTLTNATTPNLRVSGLASGSYTFRLTATDNDGYQSSDEVTVIVTAPPVANAGPDKTVTLPVSSLVINGSASDADGTVVKYLWSKFSGPIVSFLDSSTPTLTVTRLFEGTYVFKLAVTDNVGVTAFDYVTVTVNAAPSSSNVVSSTGEVAAR